MLGKFKKKLESFVDNRIVNYFSKNKKEEKETEDIDISMAEAEQRKQQADLVNNLKFSFQRDLDSLTYSKGKKQYSMDSIDSCIKKNTMTGMTGSPKDIVFTFFSEFGYIGWQICSVLAQHWLISNACSISNKDCLRNGWNNIFIDKKDTEMSDEDKDKAQETLNKLFDIEQQEFGLNDKLLKWAYYRNVFGTAFLLPKIDGIDYEQPYNPDGIKKGKFKGLVVIEPYWMIPEFDLEKMTDPTDINFFEPEYYRTNNGQKIHKSHLIIGRRKYVSDILKPSYYFGGISLAQEIYERVYASERCANEAPLLLLTKRLNYYKIKIKELFTNPQKYKQMAKVLTEMRDNQGILFADHDDDFGQIDTSLSDLDQVIMEQYKLVSAIARIPVDKLFETNPTGGLSASGDYNIKNYNQDLNTLQNDVFKPAIDRINEIVMRSCFDKKDKVGIVFNPTDNPTEKEIAELNKQKADTISVYLQNGIITPEEARQKIVEDKMSGFAFLKGVEMEEPTEEEQQDIENIMKGMEEQKEGKDEDDTDTDWITVKGNHIPIKEGETKKEAVEKFIEGKEETKGQSKYRNKFAVPNYTDEEIEKATGGEAFYQTKECSELMNKMFQAEEKGDKTEAKKIAEEINQKNSEFNTKKTSILKNALKSDKFYVNSEDLEKNGYAEIFKSAGIDKENKTFWLQPYQSNKSSDKMSAKWIGAKNLTELTEEEAKEIFENTPYINFETFGDLSHREKDIIKTYTYATPENSALRKGKTTDRSETLKKVINRTFNRREMKVYRGVTGQFAKDLLSKKVGDTIEEKGFASATDDKDIAEKFAKDGVLLHIEVPKGWGNAISVSEYTMHPEESEILLNAGKKYQITKKEGNTIHLKMLK